MVNVHCPQHLNITMVEGFKESLQAVLDTGSDCSLSIGLIEKLDSTGVQLLISFQQAMQKNACQLVFKGESEVFSQYLKVFGLESFFEFQTQT